MVKNKVFLLLIVLVFLFNLSIASATYSIEQTQRSYLGESTVQESKYKINAQSFTVPISGTVKRVEIFMSTGSSGSSSDTQVWTLNLWTDCSGLPCGTIGISSPILGSADIQAGNKNTNTDKWVGGNYNVGVTANTKYWIILSVSGNAAGSLAHWWGYSSDDSFSYANGVAKFKWPSSTDPRYNTWVDCPGPDCGYIKDFTFKVTVEYTCTPSSPSGTLKSDYDNKACCSGSCQGSDGKCYSAGAACNPVPPTTAASCVTYTAGICPSGGGTCPALSSTNKASGTSCSGGVCDGNGICIPSVNFISSLKLMSTLPLLDTGSVGGWQQTDYGGVRRYFSPLVAACQFFAPGSTRAVYVGHCYNFNACLSGDTRYEVYDCYADYPAAGRWFNSSFYVGYSMTDNTQIPTSNCKFQIKDGSAAWQDNPAVCNSGQQILITVGAGKNCSAEGLNACGIKLWATDSEGNVNSVERDFSIHYLPPLVSISSPNVGSPQSNDFNVQYSATDTNISACKIQIRNGTSANWQDKGIISCGSNLQTIVTVGKGKYCTATGDNACGVRIWANDSLNQISIFERNFSIAYCGNNIVEGSEVCDGNNQSCYTGPAGTNGFGICRSGNYTCKSDCSGWDTATCFGQITPAIESLAAGNCNDGKDNDCDGNPDAADSGCDVTPPSASININNTQNTSSTSVNLYLTYSDPTPGSGVNLSDCRYSNDAVTWTKDNCAATKSWTLTEGDGLKTVYYEVRDKVGNVKQVNDTIILDTTGPIITISAALIGSQAKITGIEAAGTPSAYNFEWTTQNISFTITCSDPEGCAKINYSYWNFDYSTKKYNNLNRYIFAKQVFGNSTSDNVTCTNGVTCTTFLQVYAADSLGNFNMNESKKFKIDLQKPLLEKSPCTYPSGLMTKSCSAGLTIGKDIIIDISANDSIGSGVVVIKVYLINSSGSETAYSAPLSGTTTTKTSKPVIRLKEEGQFTYKIYVGDDMGNNNNFTGLTFNIGGDCNLKCAAQNKTICDFYQVCSGDTSCAKDAKENLGIYCCSGKCLNRSTLSTCKQQGGEIYDKTLRTCEGGTDVPASDTIEKNRCCKGTLAARIDAESLAWYDMAGNKLTEAARGDKVKCVGIKDTTSTTAHFDMFITVGNTVLFSKNLSVSSTKKVESDAIELKETGTYKCEATLYASPPEKLTATLNVGSRPSLFNILIGLNPLTFTGMAAASVNLKVIEAPTKPRYTELPGFSAVAMLIAIAGLMIYYLARRK